MSRRATVSVMCFSKLPAGPRAPGPRTPSTSTSPPCPGSMTTVWIDGASGPSAGVVSGAGAPGVAGCPGCPGVTGVVGRGLSGGRRLGGEDLDRGAACRPVRAFDDAEGAVARALIDGDRRRVGQRAQREHQIRRAGRGQLEIERRRLEAHDQPAGLGDDRVRRRRRHVEMDARQPRLRLEPDLDARHAHVADDDQVRDGADVEARLVDERQRAIDEVHRQAPAALAAHRRRRQGDDAAADRCQAGGGGDDDGLALDGQRQALRQRILAQLDAEDARQLLGRDHLAAADGRGRHRAPAIGADDGPERLRGGGRLRRRWCRSLAASCDDDGRGERGGEHEGAQDPWGHAQRHRCL